MLVTGVTTHSQLSLVPPFVLAGGKRGSRRGIHMFLVTNNNSTTLHCNLCSAENPREMTVAILDSVAVLNCLH